jgi:hypothetical protein
MTEKRKTGLTRRLEIAAYIALHGFPALFCRDGPKPGSPAAFIVENFRAEVRAKLKAMPALQRAFLIGLWPPAMILFAFAFTAVNGRRIAREFHRSIWSQFTGQIRLAFVHGLPPTFYYAYELHEPQNRGKVHEYIHRAQLKRGGDIYGRLYRASPEGGKRANILNDKIAFTRFCRERNLSIPSPVAFISNGVFEWAEAGKPGLPPADLFVKPSKENGGDGTERWIFAGGRYREGKGRVLGEEELIRHLAKRSLRRPFLLQHCLVNHADLRDLTAGALSTLRIYTMLDEKGEAEHIFTMLRMSQDSRRIVDNVCAGGIAAEVDPSTGMLGLATDGGMLARIGWRDHHPFTGARLAGRIIPFWPEALELALSAHRALNSAIMVGWDIAVTQLGPVIVEGNKAPDIDIEQRLSGPWGNRRFGRLLVHHLKAANAQANVFSPLPAVEAPIEAEARVLS